jgi:hypothetical protein
MSRRRVVSRHILRRRARAMLGRLEAAQADARASGVGRGVSVAKAQALLAEHGVTKDGRLSVPHHRVRGKWVVEVS